VFDARNSTDLSYVPLTPELSAQRRDWLPYFSITQRTCRGDFPPCLLSIPLRSLRWFVLDPRAGSCDFFSRISCHLLPFLPGLNELKRVLRFISLFSLCDPHPRGAGSPLLLWLSVRTYSSSLSPILPFTPVFSNFRFPLSPFPLPPL